MDHLNFQVNSPKAAYCSRINEKSFLLRSFYLHFEVDFEYAGCLGFDSNLFDRLYHWNLLWRYCNICANWKGLALQDNFISTVTPKNLGNWIICLSYSKRILMHLLSITLLRCSSTIFSISQHRLIKLYLILVNLQLNPILGNDMNSYLVSSSKINDSKFVKMVFSDFLKISRNSKTVLNIHFCWQYQW